MKISFNTIPADENYTTSSLYLTLTINDGSVIEYSSNKDYRDTNILLNNLSENPEFKKYVIQNFSYKNVCHWQFFISYIWPYFFFAIECMKILNSLIKKTKLENLYYEANGSIFCLLFQDLLKSFSKKHSFSLTIKENKNRHSLLKIILKKTGALYRNISHAFLLFIFNILSFKNRNLSNDKENVFISSIQVNLELKDGLLFDRQLDLLYKGLEEKYNPIIVFSDTINLSSLLRKIIFNKLAYSNFCYHSDASTFFTFKLFQQKLLQKNTLSPFHDSLIYDGVDLKNILNRLMLFINHNVFMDTIYY